jgi:hypothetical protein
MLLNGTYGCLQVYPKPDPRVWVEPEISSLRDAGAGREATGDVNCHEICPEAYIVETTLHVLRSLDLGRFAILVVDLRASARFPCRRQFARKIAAPYGSRNIRQGFSRPSLSQNATEQGRYSPTFRWKMQHTRVGPSLCDHCLMDHAISLGPAAGIRSSYASLPLLTAEKKGWVCSRRNSGSQY